MKKMLLLLLNILNCILNNINNEPKIISNAFEISKSLMILDNNYDINFKKCVKKMEIIVKEININCKRTTLFIKNPIILELMTYKIFLKNFETIEEDSFINRNYLAKLENNFSIFQKLFDDMLKYNAYLNFIYLYLLNKNNTYKAKEGIFSEIILVDKKLKIIYKIQEEFNVMLKRYKHTLYFKEEIKNFLQIKQ